MQLLTSNHGRQQMLFFTILLLLLISAVDNYVKCLWFESLRKNSKLFIQIIMAVILTVYRSMKKNFFYLMGGGQTGTPNPRLSIGNIMNTGVITILGQHQLSNDQNDHFSKSRKLCSRISTISFFFVSMNCCVLVYPILSKLLYTTESLYHSYSSAILLSTMLHECKI